MISTVLASLKELQQSGGLDWVLNQEKYKLKVPMLLILGDAAGHDKLCGLRGGPGNPQCRYCACPFQQMGNHNANFPLTSMSKIKQLANQNPVQLHCKGYYPLKRNAFYNLEFCHPAGLNQSTPAEILHQIEKGIIVIVHRTQTLAFQ